MAVVQVIMLHSKHVGDPFLVLKISSFCIFDFLFFNVIDSILVAVPRGLCLT